MRKVILFIATSLDGYIAKQDGSVGWLFTNADYGYKGFYDSVDTVIMGRKTYEIAQALEGGIPFKTKKTYIFTHKPTKSNHYKDPVATTRKLKKAKGGNIWLVGGSEIIAELLDAGLIDEMVIAVHPVILGTGIPLSPSNLHDLRLQKCLAYESGLVQLWYSVR